MTALPDSSTTFVVVNVLFLGLLAILSLFAGTYIYTTVRFHGDSSHFTNATDGNKLRPPHLPIAIPWVGNALSFLSTKPHKFWTEVFSWYPRSAGTFRMTLGGNQTAVIFNAPAVEYILKDRKLGRDELNVQVTSNGLGLTRAESEMVYEHHTLPQPGEVPAHVEQDKTNVEYLLKTDRVNEMTAEFIDSLSQQVSAMFQEGCNEVNLFQWLRAVMFQASTKALMGQKILEVIPNLEELFFQFDQDMMSLFFGLPNFMVSKQVANRNRSVEALVGWHEAVASINKEVVDPEAQAWEPLYGSRINRARQIFYRKKNLPVRARAALDLGMLFGISSNAIPAAGWMLMHILDSMRPEKKAKDELTLYEHIMSEVRQSQNADGSLNIPILTNQPILLSTLHEVLRIYVDTLVSRKVERDMTLPLSHSSAADSKQEIEKYSPRSLFLKAGSMIMVPSWPSHTNPETWQSPSQPPPDEFYAYRFLTTSPSSEKPVFSTSPYAGMYFPFGGGKTICPGRVFAKQEILGSVAIMLLTFNFEVLGYVDEKGKNTTKFPGLRDTLPGSAVMVASGDLRVKVTRR
ncbi:hypothetical protein LTS08_007911 [Lithohypha guttulata]|uniref:uncharacterized protein n=1 Tax=Lithohypha guttulata TaxID=1690604 RepID=UPI002DDF45D8|nr:hypothetical protein LTR51_007934 [Lithohypha guttulata]KAK5095777.1 hypothetical protein LTS08_007911 [Lithohypha guttulata]